MSLEDVEIVHLVPGRVRLKSKQLRELPRLAQQLRGAFQAIPGMQSVEVNMATGSVLILYDRQAIAADGSLERLAGVLDGLFPKLDREAVLQWLRSTAR
jgi:Heavy metal associated domain 2